LFAKTILRRVGKFWGIIRGIYLYTNRMPRPNAETEENWGAEKGENVESIWLTGGKSSEAQPAHLRNHLSKLIPVVYICQKQRVGVF